jgi:hypothetical protein
MRWRVPVSCSAACGWHGHRAPNDDGELRPCPRCGAKTTRAFRRLDRFMEKARREYKALNAHVDHSAKGLTR